MGFVSDMVDTIAGAAGDLVGGAVEAVTTNPALALIAGGMTMGATGLLGAAGAAGTVAEGAAATGWAGGSSSLIGDFIGGSGAFGATAAAEAAGAGMGVGAGWAGGGSLIADFATGAGTAAGGAGIASQAGSIWDTAKNVYNTGKNVSSIYQGLSNVLSPGQSPQAAQAGADPYAAYRPAAASALNTLMSNPSQITQTPGYQFGMNQGVQALNRTMAQTGQTQSGGQQVALSQYGQQYAGQQLTAQQETLGKMSGAFQSPSAGQDAYTQAQTNQGKATVAGYQDIAAGLGSIFGNQTSTSSFWG